MAFHSHKVSQVFSLAALCRCRNCGDRAPCLPRCGPALHLASAALSLILLTWGFKAWSHFLFGNRCAPSQAAELRH